MEYVWAIFWASFGCMAWMLSIKMRLIRAGEIERHEHIGILDVVKPWAIDVKNWIVRALARGYLFVHPYLDAAWVWTIGKVHKVVLCIAQRFYRLSNAVKGKRDILRDRGATSLFIRNIAEYKDSIEKEED